MHEFFGLIAISLVVVAYVPYLIKIIRGSVKPHPFTWLVWTITATSVFILQSSYGAGPGSYATATMAFFALSVFILTARQGIPKISYLDTICFIVAILGVGVWLIIQEPVASIVILLSVELIGFIPTFIKGIKKPYEDSATLWALTASRHGMGFMAIEHYNIITILNPATWLILASSFCIVLLVRRIPVNKPRNRKRTFHPYN